MTADELSHGWQLTWTVPGGCRAPAELEPRDWIPARVPGTAAAALRNAGMWRPGEPYDFDGRDWWFRTRFTADGLSENSEEEVWLALDGIATVSEVYLNGERLLDSESMFEAHRLDVSRRMRPGSAGNELVICCRALGPLLAVSRRPRARWRTRIVSEGNLRFYRTMLLGRAPGFAAGPACVGPWKPIRVERRRRVSVEQLRVRARLDGGAGRLSVKARLRPLSGAALAGARVELAGPSGTYRASLNSEMRTGDVTVEGELVVPAVERWWPHTHGSPALHDVTLVAELGHEELAVPAGRVGFRDLRAAASLECDGLRLRVNDVPLFTRGAVWTPLDLALPGSEKPQLREVLDAVVRSGMNMLRIPGVGCYESEDFYDLCDELGILVWQDFMFANLDYPQQDSEFMAMVEREANQLLAALGRRPSLAVLCGGSEVAQQVAMLGLDPALANGPLYGNLLPRLVSEVEVQAPYVPSTPWGGDFPFRPDRGVANYYGVGAYLRPLEDARRAEVKFAAESLAFSNVPDEETLEAMGASGGVVTHHPAWKSAVPRDVGAGWDFEDVRDHYLRLFYELDPVALRSVDPERYLEFSRHVTGEVMAEVLGEWRREASPCCGALVLWLTDLVPGAGWGLIDSAHRPKVALHHVRRVLAPVAVWSTDEGLGGVVAHIANDQPERLEAVLRIALYRDREQLVDEVRAPVAVKAHGGHAVNVEELLGRFVDVSWSYRFGPPAQDVVVLTLEDESEELMLSQSFRFPAGPPTGLETATQLGLSATLESSEKRSTTVTLASRRVAYGVRIRVPGFVPDDDAFSIEPGHSRTVCLRRVEADAAPCTGYLTALNLAGRVAIDVATMTG